VLLRSGRVYLQRADPASWQVGLEMPCQLPSSRCERVRLAHLGDRGDGHMAGAATRGRAGRATGGTAAPSPGFDRLLQGFFSPYLRWVGRKYPQAWVCVLLVMQI